MIDGLTVRPFQVGMKMSFRGVESRSGLLVCGPSGWGEFSPFPEYGLDVARKWASATMEAATGTWPASVRDRIPVNVTVPAVEAAKAYRMVVDSGCTTAKVKVGNAKGGTSSVHDDEARIEAVRDALGSSGKIRLDANQSWDVGLASKLIDAWSVYDLEYVEQPVTSIEEMAELRRLIDVPIAADESVREGEAPRLIKAAADLIILKVQPLGGVNASLQLAETIGLPAVVSSALETSVGISAGLALAAALPQLDHACGLATAALLVEDVVDDPLMPVDGFIEVRRPEPSEDRLQRCSASPAEAERLTKLFEAASERGA